MNIRIDRGISKSSLIIEGNGITPDKQHEYTMMLRNEIDVFIPFREKYEDLISEYIYDVTSMISLKDLSDKNPLRYVEVSMLAGCITKCQKAIEEYLLTPEGIILNPEYIFYDRSNKQLRFCFYPDYSKDVYSSYTELVEYLLLAIDYSEEDTVKLAYEIYASVLNKDYQLEKYVDINRNPLIENVKEKEKDETDTEELIENARKRGIQESEELKETEYSRPRTKRLNPVSVLCCLLLVIIVTSACSIYIVNKKYLMLFLRDRKHLTTAVMTLSILLCIPMINGLHLRK